MTIRAGGGTARAMPAPRLIAIDGTYASGKGTLARRLAAHYDLAHLDTGKLYRATALAVMEAGGDPDSEADGVAGVAAADLDALDDARLVGDRVAQAASRVSVHPGVRAALLELQREVAAGGAVLDGRDIGTVVCPDADVKLYVDASPDVRARRRHAELEGRGDTITLAEVRASLAERDHRDATRATAPLRPADDAHHIDSSGMDADAVFARAVELVEAVLATR